MVPKITALPPLTLAQYGLDVGDTAAVATKGQPAARQLSAWYAALARLPAEVNACTAAMTEALIEIDAHPRPDELSCEGAPRRSPFYISRLSVIELVDADVRAGRVLRLVDIAESGGLPTTEEYYAERAVGGLRWVGPVLSSTGIITDEPNDPPTADAGDDETIEIGQTIVRRGRASDPDGRIASYQWRENGRIVSVGPDLVIQGREVGARAFSLFATDDRGAVSAASTFTLTVEEAGIEHYGPTVARPLGPVRRLTRNTSSLARLPRFSRRPVFTSAGDALVLPSAVYGEKRPRQHDVIDLAGRVIARDIPTGREAMASFTEPDIVIGIRESTGGDELIRADWRTGKVERLYRPGGRLLIGDGRGRPSNDDRYIVIRRLTGNTLVSFDMQRRVVIGSLRTPADYQWASVSPDGRRILLNKLPGGDGLTRYDIDFGGVRPLVREREEGDMCLADNGALYYVQCGAVPKIVNVETGVVTNIRMANRRADGFVSGVSLVPGYVLVSWAVDGAREIATMNLADGGAMWERRKTWARLEGIERREAAFLAATPSPNGRRVVYRASDRPNAGVPDLHLLERR